MVPTGDLDSVERGAFQEYTIASAAYVFKLPMNVSFDKAASISLTIMTAAFGFYQKGIMDAGLRDPWEKRTRSSQGHTGIDHRRRILSRMLWYVYLASIRPYLPSHL